MQKLVWQNANGVELDLTSGNYGITEWEGFSNTSLNIQQQQVPFQDGGVFLDALIEQRELSVTLAMQDNNNLELRYQQRRELISALNPKLGEGYLIYTNDFISKRIKCVPQIPLFETHNSDTVGTPKASLSWTCCSPYWEDLEETSIELPMGQEVTIENEGDVPVGVEIQIETGSITEPQIANATTGKYVKLTDSYEGDILIDTKTGEKKAQSKIMKYNWSSGNQLKGMAEGNGIQSIVGGTAIWKKTNENNIYSSSGVYEMFFDNVLYSTNQELFIAVGNFTRSGNKRVFKIYTSKDGNVWNLVYEEEVSLPQYNYDSSITYSATLKKYFATWKTFLYTSTDGTNWTKTNTTFSYDTKQIINIENRQTLMIVTTDNILLSTDGTTWSTSLNASVDSLTYSDNLTLAIATSGDGTIYTSNRLTTSSTWTTHSGQQSVKNIAYIKQKNRFYGNLNNVIYTSADGITWTESATIQGVERFLRFYYSVTESKVYALGTGVICTQATNDEWTVVRASAYKVSVNSMVYISETEKYFVGVGSGINNNLMVSSDFKNWQIKQVESGSSSTGIFGVAYSPTLELYCVLAGTGSSAGAIYTSTDLETWTSRKTTSAIPAYMHQKIEWIDTLGMFVATTSQNIYTSTDGINWTNAYTSANNMRTFAWAEDKHLLIVAVASGGTVIVSPDGVNWTVKNLPVSAYIDGIAYSDKLGLFCCAGRGTSGNSLIVFTSPDGDNWNMNIIGQGAPQAIVYSDKLEAFYLVGIGASGTSEYGKGLLFISRDGQSWAQREVDHCYTTGHTTFSNCLADENERKIMIGGFDSLLIESYFSDYENAINTLSQDSDMTLNLDVGENRLNYSATYGGGTCKIKYRQKYIGV